MLLFALAGNALASMVLERNNAPSILLGQRQTYRAPMGASDPMMFEKMFKETRVPIIITTTMRKRQPFQEDKENSSDSDSNGIFKRENAHRRRHISDRVKDKHRYRSKTDEPKRTDRSIARNLFFIVSIVAIGGIAFHCGKKSESRRYIRVPSNN
ncbi:hypothetical protein ENBRE01_1207 [Enteropsectra breve]|nr:hypothetical protein ENBRE01_1207 [Enteropsectra breve]